MRILHLYLFRDILIRLYTIKNNILFFIPQFPNPSPITHPYRISPPPPHPPPPPPHR